VRLAERTFNAPHRSVRESRQRSSRHHEYPLGALALDLGHDRAVWRLAVHDAFLRLNDEVTGLSHHPE